MLLWELLYTVETILLYSFPVFLEPHGIFYAQFCPLLISIICHTTLELLYLTFYTLLVSYCLQHYVQHYLGAMGFIAKTIVAALNRGQENYFEPVAIYSFVNTVAPQWT